jgi:hypothetical protein
VVKAREGFNLPSLAHVYKSADGRGGWPGGGGQAPKVGNAGGLEDPLDHPVVLGGGGQVLGGGGQAPKAGNPLKCLATERVAPQAPPRGLRPAAVGRGWGVFLTAGSLQRQIHLH